MLETNFILNKLGCNKDLINNVKILESKKVVSIDPYNNNNNFKYITSQKDDKTFSIPDYLDNLIQGLNIYILNVKNIYESILSIISNEYLIENDDNKNKLSTTFMIKLLTDLDESYGNIKNKKNLRLMLDKKKVINDDIFYYLKEYLKSNIYLINDLNKTIKKYELNSKVEKEINIIFLKKDNNYFPIFGKVDNQTLKTYNSDMFENEKFKNSVILKEFSSKNTNLKSQHLKNIQDIAIKLNINIMKPNKKGDKEIKKTKNELITEISLKE